MPVSVVISPFIQCRWLHHFWKSFSPGNGRSALPHSLTHVLLTRCPMSMLAIHLRYTWCLWFSVWTIPNHSYRWLHIQDIYWVQICCWQKNTFFLIAKCAMFKQQKTVVAASSTSSVLAEYMCALFMGKKLFINYSQWRGGYPLVVETHAGHLAQSAFVSGISSKSKMIISDWKKSLTNASRGSEKTTDK